jgi:hypothetical protein
MSHNREGNPIRAYHRTRVPHDYGANRPLVTVRTLRPWERDGTVVRDPLEAARTGRRHRGDWWTE